MRKHRNRGIIGGLAVMLMAIPLLWGCKAQAPQTNHHRGAEIEMPASWTFLDSVPVSAIHEYAAEYCRSTSVSAASVPGRVARYQLGPDTIYVDRIRSIYWPYGSYEGCKVIYDPADRRLRKQLAAHYDLASGASVDHKAWYQFKDIPPLFAYQLSGRDFIYVNNSAESPGPYGFFYPGNEKEAPVNVFGYRLSDTGRDSLFNFMESIDF